MLFTPTAVVTAVERVALSLFAVRPTLAISGAVRATDSVLAFLQTARARRPLRGVVGQRHIDADRPASLTTVTSGNHRRVAPHV
jgi:hypothetical protein